MRNKHSSNSFQINRNFISIYVQIGKRMEHSKDTENIEIWWIELVSGIFTICNLFSFNKSFRIFSIHPMTMNKVKNFPGETKLKYLKSSGEFWFSFSKIYES